MPQHTSICKCCHLRPSTIVAVSVFSTETAICCGNNFAFLATVAVTLSPEPHTGFTLPVTGWSTGPEATLPAHCHNNGIIGEGGSATQILLVMFFSQLT